MLTSWKIVASFSFACNLLFWSILSSLWANIVQVIILILSGFKLFVLEHASCTEFRTLKFDFKV